MRPFTFSRAEQPRAPGLTLPHVYVVADLTRDRKLAALVAGCRGATREEPLVHVGDAWRGHTATGENWRGHTATGENR